MKPYIMKQMKKAHEEGAPIMRPMFYDFPEDEKVYEIGDQYMFGPDILVTPVTEKGAIKRKVYLPKGAKWKEFSGDKEYEGGRWIEFDAPVNKIPAFVKNEAEVF